MADKPILFSGPMVKAILEGRKTKTRRVLKPQPDMVDSIGLWHRMPCGTMMPASKPLPIATGDRLWVRETWSGEHWLSDVKPSKRFLCPNDSRLVPLIPETWYWADGGPEYGDWERPRPSIFMPRWASRLTLTVTDVKVELLTDISEEDAEAEGWPAPADRASDGVAEIRDAYPIGWFANLWDSLNKKRGFGWDVNPWVAAYTFETHHCNIDETAEVVDDA